MAVPTLYLRIFTVLVLCIIVCGLVLVIYFFVPFNRSSIEKATALINKLKPPPKYAFVTPFSATNACKAMRACQTYSKVSEIKNKKIPVIAFHAADVTPIMLSNYTKLCPFVQLRPILLKQYPNYVSDLKNYRFKFLIVKEVLPKFETILYGDASVQFKPSLISESLTDLFKSMNKKFSKQGIRMFSRTNYPNFPVTHPLMYKYFNVSMEQMKKTKQLESTAFMVSNTTAGHNVVDKVAKCALEENCMAPKDAVAKCKYPAYLKNTKVVCHKFDQSAVNMRLIELYGVNSSKYYKNSRLISIVQTETCSLP
uniref:DUF362 domain-containing protein n=1 Tax=Panagrellus redivivus TaxID=6233 RepID=A0A7E4UXN9_PANRE